MQIIVTKNDELVTFEEKLNLFDDSKESEMAIIDASKEPEIENMRH